MTPLIQTNSLHFFDIFHSRINSCANKKTRLISMMRSQRLLIIRFLMWIAPDDVLLMVIVFITAIITIIITIVMMMN